MRIEYSHLDARLRWYGPELVLRDVRVLDRDGSQALFATRRATVALDVWNFFRTGQFVAGRLRFVAPRVTLVRLADGRFRLLGQRERPADSPPFDLERLPAGRLVVEDATVVLSRPEAQPARRCGSITSTSACDATASSCSSRAKRSCRNRSAGWSNFRRA